MNLTSPSVIKEVMARHGVSFTKSLGQNFLINPSVCPRMAQECGATPHHGVLEIGPGVGVLTKELAQRAGKVVSVELDKDLLPVLKETLAPYDNVKIIQGDILTLDLPQLFAQEFGERPVVVCANLPYYITSPIVMGLLEQKLPLEAITVMVQKEAAERLTAALPSREVGSITVSAAYYAQREILFGVSRGSFMPQPNVDSSVMKLTLYPTPPVELTDEKDFSAVVRGAFAQRRKTIANSLSSTLGVEKSVVQAMLVAAKIPSNARAEQLTLEQFAGLANQWSLHKDC